MGITKKPRRIKQIMPLPEYIMPVYKDGDSGMWEDYSLYGWFSFIQLKDNSNTEDSEYVYSAEDDYSEICTMSGDLYSEEEKGECKLIRAHKCPKCGDRMMVKPFDNNSREITYYCYVCGEYHTDENTYC